MAKGKGFSALIAGNEMRLSDRSKISTCVFQDPFLFPLAERETVLVLHLAANAIPGPVSRRPAHGAAAEITCRLYLPPAAATRNSKEKGRLSEWATQGLSVGRRRQNVGIPCARRCPLPLWRTDRSTQKHVPAARSNPKPVSRGWARADSFVRSTGERQRYAG